MTWLVLGLAILLIGPCAGAMAVAALLAFFEWGGHRRSLPDRRLVRRASPDLLEEYLAEQQLPARRQQLSPAMRMSMMRRAAPTVLYEHLSVRQIERRGRRVLWTAGTALARAPRPTRLMPLTA